MMDESLEQYLQWSKKQYNKPQPEQIDEPYYGQEIQQDLILQKTDVEIGIDIESQNNFGAIIEPKLEAPQLPEMSQEVKDFQQIQPSWIPNLESFPSVFEKA